MVTDNFISKLFVSSSMSGFKREHDTSCQENKRILATAFQLNFSPGTHHISTPVKVTLFIIQKHTKMDAPDKVSKLYM